MTLAERMLEDSLLQATAVQSAPISAQALIDAFRQALSEEWGYIWGTRGQTWTQADQNKATRAMTIQYGQKWVGRRVADCSGLFVWAYKLHNESIYHGSNTIWNKYTDLARRGPLAGEVRIRKGTAVFQNTDGTRGHIGLYIGGGMCIEAKGTKSGVVTSPLATWDEWGELTQVDYNGTIYESFNILPLDTITKGAKGELVKYLQRSLLDAGYDIGNAGVDGIFGSETLSAVRAFQHDHGLTADGKVGKKTWAAVKAVLDDDEYGEDKPTEGENSPQDPSEDSSATSPLTIEERLRRLELAVFGQEGGTEDGS